VIRFFCVLFKNSNYKIQGSLNQNQNGPLVSNQLTFAQMWQELDGRPIGIGDFDVKKFN
jgi:hypothetical protein